MIIENPQALYSWLTSYLGQLCDADPAALARYVIALVKKDKPANELIDFCCDQLEVFFEKQTRSFVDILFATLTSKSYLQGAIALGFPNSVMSQVQNIPSEVCTAVQSLQVISPSTATPSLQIDVPSAIVAVAAKTENFQKDKEQLGESEARDSKKLHMRSRSSSPCSNSSKKSLKLGSRNRDNDERLRVQRYEDKQQLNWSNQIDSASERSRQDKGRQKEYRRDTHDRSNHNFSNSDRRSRSPNSPSCASWNRNRSRSRSSSRSSRSRSRSWSRGRIKGRIRDHNLSNSRSQNKDVLQQHHASRGDCDYRVGSTEGGLNSDSSQNRASETNTKKNVTRISRRCKDYDEKGYCMSGDLCIFDHGNDPLIVEDVSALNFGPTTAQAPFQPEPYNPEAPAMFHAKRDHMPIWSATTPPPPLPRGPPPSTPLPLPSRISGVPAFNPSEPPPLFHGTKIQRTRELIGVPTLDVITTVPSVSEVSGPVTTSCSKTSTSVTSTNSSIGSSMQETFFKRKHFDYSRLGVRNDTKKNERCTLELRKIPRSLNNITLLNNHFSKFGQVKTVQVCYDNDPEAALVEFVSHAGATAAYRNSEAVLNNRFIKVFWHNKDSVNNSSQHGTEDNNSSNIISASKGNAAVLEQQSSEQTLALSTSVVNNPILVGKHEFETAKATIRTPVKVAGIPKKIFNPAALKKNNVLSHATAPCRKSKDAFIMGNVMKRMNLLKKMQEFLQSQVASKKLLLEKLAKSTSQKEQEYLKKTTEELKIKISMLQADIKKESEEVASLIKIASEKVAANKAETQKELLDAEMDLYNKQYKGDDVTDLLFKVNELKQQALGLADESRVRPMRRQISTRYHVRGRGRGRNITSIMRSVDHRPRRIHIVNAACIGKELLRNHFMQYGDIEAFEVKETNVYITFKTRKEAEMAFSLGSKLGTHVLHMQWHLDSSNSEFSKADNTESASGIEDVEMQHNERLAEEDADEDDDDDDEDEEDSEARSWRR